MPVLKHARGLSYLGLQLAAGLVLAACSGGGDAAPSSTPVCPDCAPLRLGETSSPASSQAACTLAYLKRTIDRAEAESLGFPVADAVERIERRIDEPMTWVPMEAEGGGAATGYERKTRIRGELHVESYEYGLLDPERCDGRVCKIDGGNGETTTEQAPCFERYLMTAVSGALQTLDGAIAVEFPTQAVNIAYLPKQTDDLTVAARADLSEARGTLKIDPAVRAPHIGWVDLSLQFGDETHPNWGVLGVSVTPDWDNLPEDYGSEVLGPFAYYAPIEGRWGEFPFGERPIVSAAPED